MVDSSVTVGKPFRRKWLAGLLGLLTGVLGLHRWYLGQSMWWIYPLIVFPMIGYALRQPEWFREPAFFVAALTVVVACFETIRIGLMSTEQFDQRFNPGANQQNTGGMLAVIFAVLALLAGAIVLMAVLSLAVESLMVTLRG